MEEDLTVYHFRGHDSLSLALAVFNGIVLWGATDGALPTKQGQGIVSPLHLKVIYGQVFFHLKEYGKKCKNELAWNGENSFES
ncbi:MAG: hypothetical protein MUP52_13865 [Candidatus Aminicenantes bacterium]|nr:hypothetical protein [Candidatus Aminicenantes bacterium]